jgi:N-ethylmaleimide reductase
VAEAVAAEVGPQRMGVRLAPLTTLQGAVDDTPEATYLAAAKLLDDIGVGYIHIAEADWDDAPLMPVPFKEALRMIYRGTLIYAGKYTQERAEQALQAGWADLIGFGRPFIANPDLPYRMQHACRWPKATAPRISAAARPVTPTIGRRVEAGADGA